MGTKDELIAVARSTQRLQQLVAQLRMQVLGRRAQTVGIRRCLT